jgi:transposase
MNRTKNEVRQIFLNMKAAGFSINEIVKATGKARQTIYNWINLGEDKLLENNYKNYQTPSIDLEKLKQYMTENPCAINREAAEHFGCCIKTIHKWKVKLGFTRKKVRRTYREADENKKKSLF